MMYLCPICYYNTDNDFFEPSWNGEGQCISCFEECVFDLQGYPFRKSCTSFVAAHKVDGD